jgi:signal transduction histidine kinase/ActR/RegA family two-component response regulator
MPVVPRGLAPRPPPDFEAIFAAAPTPLLLLAPSLVIEGVNDAYLRATSRTRESLLGRHVFDAFPDNPDDPQADGVRNLRASLERVLRTRAQDTMALQRYDIPVGDGDRQRFEERHWSPVNTPVLDADGEVAHIIHRVEDVTEFVRTRTRADVSEARVAAQVLEIQAANDRLRRGEQEALRAAAQAQAQSAQLDAVLEAAPVAIYVVDEAGRLLRQNPESLRLWQERPATLGEPIPFTDWVGFWRDGSPRDGTPVAAHEWPLARALKGDRTLAAVMEVFGSTPTGPGRAVMASAAPIRDAQGHVAGAVAVVMDIGDRVRAEAALHEAESRYRQLFEHMTEEVQFWRLVRDDDGSILTWRLIDANPAALESWGRRLEDIRGLSADEIFGPGATEHERPVVEAVFRDGRPASHEGFFPALGRHFRFTTIPLGEAFITTGADITPILHARQTIERQNQALREADARKDRFLAMLSHELRNPLAPIGTAAELLARPGLPQQSLDLARGVIQRQARQMALLLDDLLDVSRITQGKLQLRPQTTQLQDIVDSAVEAVRPLVERKHHRLDIELPDPPPLVHADPLRLSQVLVNLLGNAAKYTSDGGRIRLRAMQDGADLVLEVADDGIGIAADALPTVFDMFSQVREAADHADGGLGIGLALVQGIVQLHGGSVGAASEGPGRGSTFTVRLPAAVRNDPQAEGPRQPATTATRSRVLVADDNRDAADMLAELALALGHEVRVAYDGGAAVALAASFRPQVALLDIGMPVLDGHEVARALRKEPWGSDLLLVAVTGWGQAGDREKARQAGFDHHMTKPVDVAALEDLLASALSGTAGRTCA